MHDQRPASWAAGNNWGVVMAPTTPLLPRVVARNPRGDQAEPHAGEPLCHGRLGHQERMGDLDATIGAHDGDRPARR